MKNYCLKCKKDTENIDPEIEQKIINYLCNRNVLTVKIRSQDL